MVWDVCIHMTEAVATGFVRHLCCIYPIAVRSQFNGDGSDDGGGDCCDVTGLTDIGMK